MISIEDDELSNEIKHQRVEEIDEEKKTALRTLFKEASAAKLCKNFFESDSAADSTNKKDQKPSDGTVTKKKDDEDEQEEDNDRGESQIEYYEVEMDEEEEVKEGKLERGATEMPGQYEFRGRSIFNQDGSISLSVMYRIFSKSSSY